MEPCRYDTGCWRHCARLGTVGAALPDGLLSGASWRRVPQITVPVPFQEETIEVIKPFPAERIPERTVEQIVLKASSSDPGTNSGSRGGHSARAHFRAPCWCAIASDLGRDR